ncbi:MAG: class B sortase [Ruminococcus sp.]|nr:class B sortase [Ruminococcus sp.]
MAQKKKGGIIFVVVFLLAAAALIVILCMSKQCGGTREIQQAQVEIPTTTTTTSTTTTTTTTSTTTTTTTTTQKVVDYDMKLDLAYVEEYDAVNADVAGWLYIEGTVIDYPIIQCGDNYTYIHQDWMGNYSYSGCIYADFRGDIDESNLNLLYGHNMADGSMLSSIRGYLDEEWGKERRYFEVASEEKRYLYEVFSVNVLYGESGADFTYWMPDQSDTLELSKADFKAYINSIKSSSNVWYADEDDMPEYGDQIIGLQTCNSGADDGMRCVLFAKCLGER